MVLPLFQLLSLFFLYFQVHAIHTPSAMHLFQKSPKPSATMSDMARNLGHSAEGVAGSEIIASLKIQLKNS